MIPKISIIVPVYNVEKYLPCCIDSILKQTFTDFELILVNDGSPDNCGKICDEYSIKDKRIKVIHKENGGLSAARNIGINKAKGEYIGFIDSDDFIDTNMYEILYKVAKENSSDIVVCGVHLINDGDELSSYNKNLTNINIENCSRQEALYKLYNDVLGEFVYAVNKLYRRKLFEKIRFKEGRIFEDEFIIHKLYYNSEIISFLNTKLYYYVQRNNSIINSPYSIRKFDKVYAHFERVNFFKDIGERDLFNIGLKHYLDYFIWNYFIAKTTLDDINNDIKVLKKTLEPIFYDLMKCPNISWKQKIMLVLFVINPSMYQKFIKIS